jgi:uncharacterized membrane protein
MEKIIRHNYWTPNVGSVERALSVIAGSLLVFSGLKKKSIGGTAIALAGAAFLRRGVTGFCYSYQAMGVRTRAPEPGNVSVPYELGVRIDEAITVNRPRAEVYRFWRDLSNLAKFVDHLDSVRSTGEGKRSHWIAKGPGGRCYEWDAEIINDIEDELIAWRSLAGSEVDNAGSVSFHDAAGDRGTEIRIELQYNPPMGAIGALAARFMGEQPSTRIRHDLMRLKTALESGVFATTEGQPSGSPKPSVAHEKKQKADHQVAAASESSFPASDAPAYTQ